MPSFSQPGGGIPNVIKKNPLSIQVGSPNYLEETSSPAHRSRNKNRIISSEVQLQSTFGKARNMSMAQ